MNKFENYISFSELYSAKTLKKFNIANMELNKVYDVLDGIKRFYFLPIKKDGESIGGFVSSENIDLVMKVTKPDGTIKEPLRIKIPRMEFFDMDIIDYEPEEGDIIQLYYTYDTEMKDPIAYLDDWFGDKLFDPEGKFLVMYTDDEEETEYSDGTVKRVSELPDIVLAENDEDEEDDEDGYLTRSCMLVSYAKMAEWLENYSHLFGKK